MLDRYGENDELQALTPAERAEIRNAAITRCTLCDGDGYRGGAVCDHQDHRDAAKRGMAAVRQAMGWTR